jgi:hypothetical protein
MSLYFFYLPSTKDINAMTINSHVLVWLKKKLRQSNMYLLAQIYIVSGLNQCIFTHRGLKLDGAIGQGEICKVKIFQNPSCPILEKLK